MAKEEKNNRLKAEYRSIESWFQRQLAISLARPMIEQAFFIAWAILDGLLIVIFAWVVMAYLSNGSFIDARQSASVLYNVEATGRSADRGAPVPLAVGEAKVSSVEAGKYDIYAEVVNYNPDWYATFDYVFEFGGGVSERVPGFINPDETRLLAAIHTEADSRPTSVSLRLDNFVWSRVDKHTIGNVAEFLEDRNNITLDDATYSKDITVGSDELARTQLTLTNRTAYAYWEPEFLVKLMRGNTIVSLTRVTVPEFKAQETRVVDIRWLGAVPETASIAVEPVIPFFDPEAYMKPSGE